MTLLKTLLTTLAPSGAAAVTIAAINGDRFLSPLNGTGKQTVLDVRGQADVLTS